MFGTMAKAMDVPTLIITPRNVLNKQTRKEFCEEIGIPESEVAAYDSTQKTGERRRVLEGNPPPKFVITSYQSLPSLLERHELDVTNPKDIHYRPLVILDEVHEAQGPKTTETLRKLKDHVLLAGFTATDAGAAETLFDGQPPIYKLPIVDALERGLLCHGARTGAIDVAINEEWIDNFLKTPKGADYKREDVEKFAHNPSVVTGAIEFHLKHEDMQLGKLSRLPTIFYTEGVNAARDGAKQFNETAEKLGIKARAAFVSGDMKPNEYGPILEQFKRGEIQAIWNDQLLGMGFDARNATVCYSLKPSRMPHVVEQQLGRVTRREGADYVEKYGQDKVALAINVRGKGMNPVLFGEVLEGRAALYSRDYTPPSEPESGGGTVTAPKPELPEGIDVHLDYKDMHTVLAGAMKGRDELPMKTEEWLSPLEMAIQTQRDKKNIYPIYEAWQLAWKHAKNVNATTFTVEGIIVPIDKVGIFQSGSQKVFCLHKDTLPFLTAPQKTSEWLDFNDIAKLTNSPARRIYDLYHALQGAWTEAKENEIEKFTAKGITLSVDMARMCKAKNGALKFCLHQSIAKDLVAEEIFPKTDEWLGILEMEKFSGTNHKKISRLYKSLEIAWQKSKADGKPTFTTGDIAIPVDKARICKGKMKTFFCIHADMIPFFYTPEKTPEWLSIDNMAAQLITGSKRIGLLYKASQVAWKQAKEANAANFTIEGITIPTDKAGIFKSNTNYIFCFHESVADLIRNYRPSSRSFVDEVGGKRSIAPESDHLKRTGRMRGKKEE